jgi:hypothetical protein
VASAVSVKRGQTSDYKGAALMLPAIDLPLKFHPAALRASVALVRSPTLDRRKVEFSGLMSRRRAGCAGGSHEGNRGLVADRPMRPNLVVVLAPILQLFAGVGKRQEPVSVQALGS